VKLFDRERRLLRRAAGGDADALSRLYDEHVDALYAFVFYRVGRDRTIAEDAVQETFARALDGFHRFDPGRGSLRSWLLLTSRNAIRDQLRAERRDEVIDEWDRIDASLARALAALDREPLSDEVIERAETRDLVNMTIANLHEQYRTVLHGKYVEGASLEQLSARLGISTEATKSLLARARRAFREVFGTLAHSMAEAQR
jgi:RNA polymerase sigma-70 factor (ECF subfamily)